MAQSNIQFAAALRYTVICQRAVPPHPFGKRRVRTLFGVIAQELLAGRMAHSLNSNRCR